MNIDTDRNTKPALRVMNFEHFYLKKIVYILNELKNKK